MDAPRCGLCGERHWSGEGHRWKDGDVFATGPMANSMANAPDVSGSPLPCGVGSISGAYKYRDTEKRRTYQRDLMRKRRLEKRGVG